MFSAVYRDVSGTATVKLTLPINRGETRVRKLTGCFVKNDANLESYITKIMSPSDDKNILKGSKFLFYAPAFDGLDGIITKAVITYWKILKNRCPIYETQKEKSCEIKEPLTIIDAKHFFLCCDSKDLNECKFLEEESKAVRINKTLGSQPTVYGLGKTENGLPRFITFNMKQTANSATYRVNDETDYEKLEDAGPLLLSDKKTVVGCYKKIDNRSISISIFWENQDGSSPVGVSVEESSHSTPNSTTAVGDQQSGEGNVSSQNERHNTPEEHGMNNSISQNPSGNPPGNPSGNPHGNPSAIQNPSLRNKQEFNKHRKLLVYYARNLTDSWQTVGSKLHLSYADEQDIKEHNKDDVREQAYQMILRWIQKCEVDPAMPDLRKALEDAGRKDLSEYEFRVASGNEDGQATLADHELNEIANHLPRDWKFVGRLLQMEENVIKTIEKDQQGKVNQAAREMLNKWKQIEGDAKASVLKEALEDLERRDLTEKIEGWIPSSRSNEV